MHDSTFKLFLRFLPRLHFELCASIFLFTMFLTVRAAAESPKAPSADSFPNPAEVFQGRTFSDDTERDVFFLRAIHDRYNSHWAELLEANINEQDYLLTPGKLLRFVTGLGIAMQDRDDPVAVTNLALLTSDKRFFTDINAYRPEILRAAAQALMQIGPAGRAALAASFSQKHYQDDPASLEELAKIIGGDRTADPLLADALSLTAFGYTTTNGGIYPRCTTEAVKNLLCLPAGTAEVQKHLNTNEIFGDPVRFQAVIDGIAAARATELATNLTVISAGVKAKVLALKATPGDYRDALDELQDRIQRTLEAFGAAKPRAN